MITGGSGSVPDAVLESLVLLPADRPVTSAEAREMGLTYAQLRQLVRNRLVTRPVRGVYLRAELEDSLALRVQVLKLIVPEACVVTDRTAGWLWGANMILAPNDHLVVPRVSVFCPPGYRLRNALSASGERRLAPGDVHEIEGLRVTTPLRTACDLGRLLYRDQALAALDSLAALRRFTLDELLHETARFRRYRGVIQLRALALLVDPRSESPGESVLRLRWLDTGLPRPQCQVEVPTPWGTSYWVDIGLPELLFGAEYDGEEFHGEQEQEHDHSRRGWLREEGGWTIEVARKANVFGREQDIHQSLRIAYDRVASAARVSYPAV